MKKALRPERKRQLLLILIFTLGFALRLYHIGFLDIWRDEAFSINVASEAPRTIIDISVNDAHPPLHLFVLNGWMSLFGHGAVSARMPSLIFGMLTIYFTYVLSTLVFHDATYRLLTTLFASINPLLIVYSQETRAYSMLTAFTAATIYFACRMHGNRRLGTCLGFILFSVLGLYTHDIFVAVMAAIMIATVIRVLRPASRNLGDERGRRNIDIRHVVVCYACIGLCYLPWFAVLMQQYARVEHQGFWLHFDPIRQAIENYGWFFTSQKYNRNFHAPDWLAYTFVRLFAVWLSLGGVVLELVGDAKSSLKLSWLVAFMLGFVFLISFKTPLYYVRYLIFVVPALLPLLSLGITGLRALAGRRIAIVLTVMFITSNLVLYLTNIAQNTYKAQYRRALQAIQFEPATDIILHPHAVTFHSFTYYSDLPSYIYDPNRDIAHYEGLACVSAKDYYDEDLARYTRIWAMNLWKDERFENRLGAQGFVAVGTQDFAGGLFVELWTKTDRTASDVASARF